MKVMLHCMGDLGCTFLFPPPSPTSSSFRSFFHASPLSPRPEDHSFPVQPVQPQPVLKARESLGFLTVLPGRPREVGVPERLIPLGPSFLLTLTRLQQQS